MISGRAQKGQDVTIMDAAMQWALRLRDEAVTEEDLAAWMQWYEQDERHKAAFDEMQEFWHFTGGLVSTPGADERIRRLRGVNLDPVPKSLALAAGIVLAIALPLTLYFIDAGEERIAGAASTPELSEKILPDGSQVQLAAKSSVIVRYTDRQRWLEMDRGEAHFSVAPNPHRPFIVAVGNLRVRALGTAFNVRKAGERVVVTVDQGLVEVYSTNSAARVRIAAGSEGKWAASATEPIVTAADVERALAWREGRLEYIDEPLSAVIDDLNRYAKRPVVIRDAAVGRLTFTGTIFTQSTSEWLQALPGEFPVNLVADGGEALVLVSRDGT